MIKKTIKALLYLVFLVAVVVIMVELGARLIPGWNQWINIVNNPDHRIPPHSAKDINSDGIRSRLEASDFKEEDFNIIFLGDSFTYGLWLGDKQSIPQQFEKIAREKYPGRKINVANFGWVSSSPLLSYRLLKDIGYKYKPDLIIQIIDMTDVGDDLYYDAMLNHRNIYKVGQYLPTMTLLLQKLIREHTNWDGVSQWMFGLPRKHYFIVKQPLEKTRFGFDFMRTHIEETNEYAHNTLSSNYMLFIMPRYFQYNTKESPQDWEKLAGEYDVPEKYALEPFKYFAEMKNTASYPVYSLLPDFQNSGLSSTVFPNDAHLNKDGALFAAQAIFKYCEQEKCLEQKHK